MTSEERNRRRFSEAFRKEQVRLIESGKLTIRQVCMLYEVRRESVRRWINKYGKEKLPGRIIIQSPSEINRIKELEEQLEHVKKVMADIVLENLELKAWQAKSREILGPDFEKKTKSKSS